MEITKTRQVSQKIITNGKNQIKIRILNIVNKINPSFETDELAFLQSWTKSNLQITIHLKLQFQNQEKSNEMVASQKLKILKFKKTQF